MDKLKKIIFFGIVLLIFFVITGIYYMKNIHTSSKNPSYIVTYFSDKNFMFLVPVFCGVAKNELTPAYAIDHLAGAESPDKNLIKVFPPDTKLLSFKYDNGMALLDFSGNLKKAFSYGENETNILINSITYTLSHFPEIKGVKLFIEGEPVKIMGGQDLSDGIEIDRWKNVYLSGKESENDEKMTLYFIDLNSSYLVPVTCSIKRDDLMQNVISCLASGIDGNWVKAVLPSGARVISFKIEDKTAFIDFNSVFLNIINDTNKDLIMNSLILTLSDINNINELNITVEGKKLNNLPSKILKPEAFNIVSEKNREVSAR